MYENAKYIRDPMTGENYAIQVDINDVPSTVPLDPANTDYQNIMTLVDEGKLVIQPADGVE
jgi:hypothetical protein